MHLNLTLLIFLATWGQQTTNTTSYKVDMVNMLACLHIQWSQSNVKAPENVLYNME